MSAAVAGSRRKIHALPVSIFPRATATGREAPTLLLATCKPRSYNTQVAALLLFEAIFPRGLALMDKFEEFGKRINDEFARLKRIKNFEAFGKRVYEELDRVKRF